jgi:hypothetical protein
LVLPLDHLAAIDADGSVVKNPRAPARLVFVPAFSGFRPDENVDFREQFSRIAPMTRLYDVFASDSLTDDTELVRIGHVITESPFVASRFGDEQLFFQHFMPTDEAEQKNDARR